MSVESSRGRALPEIAMGCECDGDRESACDNGGYRDILTDAAVRVGRPRSEPTTARASESA